MLVWERDTVRGTSIAIWTAGECDEASHQRYLQLIREEIERCRDGATCVSITMMDEGFKTPNARQRREAAELMAQVPPHVVYVVATRSRLARGVATAMHWLSPPKFHFEVVDSLPAAEAVLREKHSFDYPRWQELERRARASAFVLGAG